MKFDHKKYLVNTAPPVEAFRRINYDPSSHTPLQPLDLLLTLPIKSHLHISIPPSVTAIFDPSQPPSPKSTRHLYLLPSLAFIPNPLDTLTLHLSVPRTTTRHIRAYPAHRPNPTPNPTTRPSSRRIIPDTQTSTSLLTPK